MQAGLNLTLIGMGIVYLVLGIIWGSVVILGILDSKFKVEEPVAASAASSEPILTNAAITDEETAAVKAALAMHTGMNADSFDIRIHT